MRSTGRSGRSATRSASSAPANNNAASHWPARLATADPTNPSRGKPSQPYTSSGHSSADNANPATTWRSGRTVSCTPRIHPFPASETRMAGTPRIAIRSQGRAAVATAALPAIADTAGTATTWTAAMVTTPRATAIQVACTPSWTAAARSPAPNWRAERAVVPYDRNVDPDPTRPSTRLPMARPASDTAPSRPTTAVSNNR